MGNIVRETIPDGIDIPDLRKGVVSIFANLPIDSVTAKRAEAEAGVFNDYNGVMIGVIPLITWGPQQTSTIYQFGTTDTISVETFPAVFVDVDLNGITASHTAETAPSFIGVFVGTTSSPTLELIVHIQAQHGPTCVDTTAIETDAHWDSGSSTIVSETEDASYVDENAQDYFGNAGINASSFHDRQPFGRPVIAAGTEVAFHILVSWDLTNGAASHGVADAAEDETGTASGVDEVSKLWCAIDGVNKNGHDLPATWAYDDTESGDPNEILSKFTGAISGNYGAGSGGIPSATLTMTSTSIPFFPVAVPSHSSLMREGTPFVPNPNLREARIQFFAGASINTSIEANVSAFRTEAGLPAPTSSARSLLGVAPLLEFSTANRLINGTNSGTAGNLTKTGTISTYPGSGF